MNGDAFRRAQAGQPMELSAVAWNACLDAAEAHRRKNQGRGFGEISQFRQADIVLVKNESGSDVDRFGILGIAGVVFTAAAALLEFQGRVAFRGTTPTTSHAGKFLVCLDPIANGKIGRAWVGGVCAAKVQIASSSDAFCDVLDGNRSKLTASNSGSARILYKEGDSGEQWCVIRLGDAAGGGAPPIRLAQTSGEWSNEAPGNIKAVQLFIQPSSPSGPNDWIPETDSYGDPVFAVTMNVFSSIPVGQGDVIRWCAVVPISDLQGEYDTGQVTYNDGVETPIMRAYDKLWLLLAVEC